MAHIASYDLTRQRARIEFRHRHDTFMKVFQRKQRGEIRSHIDMKVTVWRQERLAFTPGDIDNLLKIVFQFTTTSPYPITPSVWRDVPVSQGLFAANRKSDHEMLKLSRAPIQTPIQFYC